MDNNNEIALSLPNSIMVPLSKNRPNHKIITKSLSKNTVRAYKSDLSCFCHWLIDKQIELDQDGDTLHFDDTEIFTILNHFENINGSTVASYMTSLAFKCKISTIKRKYSAVKWGLMQIGKPLEQSKEAKETLSGLVSLYAEASSSTLDCHELPQYDIHNITPIEFDKTSEPMNGAMPILFDTLKKLIDRVKSSPNKTKATRDSAMLALWFFGALRISEISKLNLRDVKFCNQGVTLSILDSKTDKNGKGQQVAITPLSNQNYCPVSLLKAWLKTRGDIQGRLFVKVSNRGTIPENLNRPPLSASGINRHLKSWLDDVDVHPKGYSGHSLRKGFITDAYLRGADRESLIKQGRWKSGEMLSVYIQSADLFKSNATNSFN